MDCKLSVVVTTYKKLGFIKYNVKKPRDCNCEIIVAADEPEDELLQLIEEHHLKATVSDKRGGSGGR